MTTYANYTFVTPNNEWKNIVATSLEHATTKLEASGYKEHSEGRKTEDVVALVRMKRTGELIACKSLEDYIQFIENRYDEEQARYYLKPSSLEDIFTLDGVWYNDFKVKTVRF